MLLQENIKKDQKLEYVFTSDTELLQDYFKVRKQVYMETFRIEDFSTHDDAYDDTSCTDFLLVFSHGKVVGGSRLTFHFSNTDKTLPMEDHNFLLDTMFPSFNLRQKTYIEITRMAVLPEYRVGREVGNTMIKLQVIRAVDKGAEYLFSVTPLVQGRNNRMHFRKLGYEMKTCNDVIVPDKPAYEGKKMYLAITDIHNKYPIEYEESTVKQSLGSV